MATLKGHQFCGLVPRKRSAILQQKRLAVPADGKKRLQSLGQGSSRCLTAWRMSVAERLSRSQATFSLSSRDGDLLASANPHEEYLDRYSPLVKMCGITTPEDASLVAQAGAWYVGMIMWPHSKRSVKSMSLAREICAAAREFGAEPVGVFVSESASEIERVCDAAGLSFAQLHGDGARASILELSRSLKTIYVMQSDAQGCLQTMISPELEKVIDWVLVDGLEGGRVVYFHSTYTEDKAGEFSLKTLHDLCCLLYGTRRLDG